MQFRKGRLAIDFAGMTLEEARSLAPSCFQKLLTEVKPLRDPNPRDSIRKLWWRFAWERPEIRKALRGLGNYFVTLETAKHRYFVSISETSLWDGSLFAIASNDWFIGGILSSSVHCLWALVNGGKLGPTPRYNRARCYETFPFPALEEGELKQRIRELGERLDAHRKRQQAQHPALTLTGIYNVLEKLRTGEALTSKDKTFHDQGLVTLLKQLHDDLDAAVLEAYGWRDLATAIPLADRLAGGGAEAEVLEQQLLVRLVALNHERAAEEKRGLIRWLRPDYQAPGAAPARQTEIALPDDDEATQDTAAPVMLDWPADLPAQVAAVRKLLPAVGQDPETLSACFGRKSAKRTALVAAILATLRALGHLND